jgi:hypothetical protein
MWVTAVIILALLIVAEGVFVLSDKLPWKKQEEKKERWWENDQHKRPDR